MSYLSPLQFIVVCVVCAVTDPSSVNTREPIRSSRIGRLRHSVAHNIAAATHTDCRGILDLSQSPVTNMSPVIHSVQ